MTVVTRAAERREHQRAMIRKRARIVA